MSSALRDKNDDNISREFIDPKNTQKWLENKKVIETQWLEPLHFVLVTLQYLNDSLKDVEATVGWWLILITSFTSFLTLFTPKDLGTSDNFNAKYSWTKGVTLSILSFTATLLASWAKKKGFVKRIKDLDKRIFAIESKRSGVASVLDLPIEDRAQYITFYKEHINEVQDLLCYNQLISPTEMNEVLYSLTKNYPILIKDIKPWYVVSDNGGLIPDYEYGYNVIKSFEKKQLTNIRNKIFSLFYCKSSCCYEIDDGNPFTNKVIMSSLDKHKSLKTRAQSMYNLDTPSYNNQLPTLHKHANNLMEPSSMYSENLHNVINSTMSHTLDKSIPASLNKLNATINHKLDTDSNINMVKKEISAINTGVSDLNRDVSVVNHGAAEATVVDSLVNNATSGKSIKMNVDNNNIKLDINAEVTEVLDSSADNSPTVTHGGSSPNNI